MSDLTIRMSTLSSDQVDAITHAWLDLCASKEHFEAEDQFTGVGADELAVACRDSLEELEKEFPFLLEDIETDVDEEPVYRRFAMQPTDPPKEQEDDK